MPPEPKAIIGSEDQCQVTGPRITRGPVQLKPELPQGCFLLALGLHFLGHSQMGPEAGNKAGAGDAGRTGIQLLGSSTLPPTLSPSLRPS